MSSTGTCLIRSLRGGLLSSTLRDHRFTEDLFCAKPARRLSVLDLYSRRYTEW